MNVYGGYADIYFEDLVTLDITDLYQDWKTGAAANYGVMYQRYNYFSENGNWNSTASSDNAVVEYRPALIIEYTTDVSPVPEPATMLLLGSGLAGLAGFRRKSGRS